MTSEFKSAEYWESRYAQGRNSGSGSYDDLARFKAEVLNAYVAENDIESVIEFGCGDGNQLTLATYPAYIGIDVSPTIIDQCKKIFADDSSKTFLHSSDYRGEVADLSMSLDVIYHLVEDAVFDAYMRQLFSAARRGVVVYSTDFDRTPKARHVRHRKFSDWVVAHAPNWRLVRRLPNKYPPPLSRPKVLDPSKFSYCDFFFFGRRA